jgi:hypothetical protein
MNEYQQPTTPHVRRRPRPTKRQFLIRRIVVLAILLIALFGIFKIVSAAVGFVSDTIASRNAPDPTSNANPTPGQTSNVTKACDDTDIDVSVNIADGPKFTFDETVTLSATITNIGLKSCLRDVGARANEVFVTNADGELVWSSNRCPANKKINLVEMAPMDVYQVVVSWGGFKNPTTCGETSEHVPVGTYQMTARNGDAQAEPATITFE